MTKKGMNVLIIGVSRIGRVRLPEGVPRDPPSGGQRQQVIWLNAAVSDGFVFEMFLILYDLAVL